VSTRAWKFTAAGAVAPFTSARWPAPAADGPGDWVQTAGVDPCRTGVHACDAADLVWWVAPELWEVELDGDVTRHGRKLVAARGRLLAAVEGWSPPLAAEWAQACVDRARARAVSALRAAGHDETAGRLEAAEGPAEIITAASEVAPSMTEFAPGFEPHAAELVARVRDGSHYASLAHEHAPEGLYREGGLCDASIATYIARSAAVQEAGSRAAAAEEAAWQSAWLVERLGLGGGS